MGSPISELTRLEQGHIRKEHRYTLTAPIAGTVVAQNAVRGQGVAPGDELFEVVDTSRVWVFANLSDRTGQKIQRRRSGTITPKGGEPITAPLTYLAPVADETTSTIRVRFEVANPQGQLKPREYVEVALTLAGPRHAGRSVLGYHDHRQDPEASSSKRESGYTFAPIDTGREGGGWIEIRQGVSEGDRLS